MPKTLPEIGYNPFVGCENIEFESKTPNYVVEDGVLFTKDKTKIVCWPAKYAKEVITIPECVETLERGAFSCIENLEEIHLNKVKVINKNCFCCCNNLKRVYSESDSLQYIGEYVFNNCSSFSYIELSSNPFMEKTALANTGKVLVRRATII